MRQRLYKNMDCSKADGWLLNASAVAGPEGGMGMIRFRDDLKMW